MTTKPAQFQLFNRVPGRPRTRACTVVARGHAAPPGTGPAGETCGTCANCRFRIGRKRRRFYKCRVQVRVWDNSRATDVLKSSPACRHWQAGQPTATGIIR